MLSPVWGCPNGGQDFHFNILTMDMVLEPWPGTDVLEPKKIFGNFENNIQVLIEKYLELGVVVEI